MTQINLIPWREQKREQEKKLFTTMLLIASVISVCIVFIINSYAHYLISNQTERNQILKEEITSLDKKLIEIKSLKRTREELVSRMAIIQDLQSTRTLMVHLFDELIKISPTGIFISKLERKNDVVSLSGYAESNTNISILMTNIENDPWMRTPVLMEIKNVDEKKQAANNEFNLTFILKPKYGL